MKDKFSTVALFIVATAIFMLTPIAKADVKQISINNQKVTLQDGYQLYVSGICQADNGKYGLIQFSISGDAIKTLACAPRSRC